MPRKKKSPEKRTKPLDHEWLAEMIGDWNEHRRVRDQVGDRHESEKLLASLTGRLTDFDLLHRLINAAEEAAELEFQEWRQLLDLDQESQERPTGSSCCEILAFYELLRVVNKCPDPQIRQAWYKQRTWSELLLIPLLLAQGASGSIKTW